MLIVILICKPTLDFFWTHNDNLKLTATMEQSHECINDFTKMQSKWFGDKADTQKIGCPRLLLIWRPYQVLLLVSRWKYVWLSQKKGYILVDLILSTTPSNTFSNFLTQVSYGSLLVRASKHLQNCQLHILFHVQSLWLQWSPEQQIIQVMNIHFSFIKLQNYVLIYIKNNVLIKNE